MAGIVKSVEYLTIDYDATSEPVTTNLTSGQDETQCVPFYTKQLVTGALADDWRERMQKVEIIDNAGTAAVKVTAAGKTDADDHRLKIFVVEFEATINVQQVDADIADASSSANITVTDVGAQNQAFLIYTYDFTHTIAIDRPDYGCVRPIWNGASTTSVTIERTNSTGTIDGKLYVVDCDSGEFTVDHQDIAIASTDELDNTTISSTVLADSFIIAHYRSSEGGDDPLDAAIVADLSTTTNIRCRRAIVGASGAAANVAVQVVECQNNEWEVQRGDWTSTVTNPDTISITAVDDLDFSFVKTGTHEASCYDLGTSDLGAGNTIDERAAAFDFNSVSQLGIDRDRSDETGNIVPWEVVEFSTSTVVITDVNTTETWDDGDTGLVITGTGFT